METAIPEETGVACPICGGTHFVAGPGGRLSSTRKLPRCTGCGSLERHRILRRVYAALPQDVLAAAEALQFSDDIGAPRERFARFEVSVYGGAGSLDITRIDRPSVSLDWVIANHVIEHVADDRAVLRELARLLRPGGVLQLTVPTPATLLVTREFGFADPARQGHWRGYGSDFADLIAATTGHCVLQAIAHDPVTGAHDHVFLSSRDRDALLGLGRSLLNARIPAVWRAADA